MMSGEDERGKKFAWWKKPRKNVCCSPWQCNLLNNNTSFQAEFGQFFFCMLCGFSTCLVYLPYLPLRCRCQQAAMEKTVPHCSSKGFCVIHCEQALMVFLPINSTQLCVALLRNIACRCVPV